jgi:hypothetical protein
MNVADQEEYGGFHGVREVEGDDSVMEIADDSVQGFFEHKGMYILLVRQLITYN